MRIIDLHCDTILQLMVDEENSSLRNNEFSVDIDKLITSRSLAQFFALYVDLEENNDPMETFTNMLNKFNREIQRNSDVISTAYNYDDIIKNDNEGKISAVLTIEEGGVIKGSIGNLKKVYDSGVRLITLTWNYKNEIGYPNCEEQYRNMGLTEFGKEVVYEMNKLGMIIDTSHLSDAGFYDVVKLSKKPFVASHSNARTVKSHTRNLTDDMIKVLAQKGGVMGINFEKFFLSDENTSRVEDMIRHIKHIKNVGGIDVISIGTDFDGISPSLEVSNIGEIYKLIDGIRKSGFSEDEIEKICYKNALRVIKDVCK